MPTNNSPLDSRAEDEPAPDGEVVLPDYLSPVERHDARQSADMHPAIEWDDPILRNRERFGGNPAGRREMLFISSDDKLIAWLNGRCPVCQEEGTLTMVTERRGTFCKGITVRRSDGRNEAWDWNQTMLDVEEEGYGIISCRAPGDRSETYFVGLAMPDAVEGYEDYQATEDERRQFRETAQELAAMDRPRKSEGFGRNGREVSLLDGALDHGHLLAAIYESLGLVSYDERELMDRSHATKTQLATILARLQTLETRPRNDLQEADWLKQKQFGITKGRVQWDIPEWVDFDGLNYSHRYRDTLFGE